jgi:hypothetical protein
MSFTAQTLFTILVEDFGARRMIAISYRREDSLPVTGRLSDRMLAEFGKGNVFMDFDSIPYGVDFRAHIREMIERSKVVVAMIGHEWAGPRRFRGRRLDDVNDFVRLEIAHALELGLPLIPVLINNTPMPKVQDLPVGLEALAYRNALTLDAGIDFHHHADRLIAAVKYLLAQAPAQSVAMRTQPAIEPTAAPQTRAELPQSPKPTPISKVPSEPRIVPEPAAIAPKMAESPSIVSAPPAAPIESPITQIEAPEIAAVDIQPAKTVEPTLSAAAVVREDRAAQVVREPPIKNSSLLVRARNFAGELQERFMADYFRPHRTTQPGSKAEDRRRKTILAVATALGILLVAGGTWYLVTAGRKQPATPGNNETALASPPKTVTTEAPPPMETSAPAEPPVVAVQPTVAPPSVSKPAPTPASPIVAARGELKIDSNPQGVAYELIDGDGHHRNGTTPATVTHLPTGPAQLTYKSGGREYHEVLWVEADKQMSANWSIPEPTSNAPNWNERISQFVQDFVVSDDLPDVGRELSFYNANAEIFNEGTKTLDAIRHDIETDHARWPVRTNRLNGPVNVFEEEAGHVYRATFTQAYHAENPARHQSNNGAVDVDLRITIADGVPKITSIQHQGVIAKSNASAVASAAPQLQSASVGRNLQIIPGSPQNLVRVANKTYGFSVLVPSAVFLDAAQPSTTDRMSFATADNRTTLKLLVHEDINDEGFKNLYQELAAEHTPAQPNKKVHYKPWRTSWFVVSGVDGERGERGFYIKAVRKGNYAFLMSLDYDEDASPLTPRTLSTMVQGFNGN